MDKYKNYIYEYRGFNIVRSGTKEYPYNIYKDDGVGFGNWVGYGKTIKGCKEDIDTYFIEVNESIDEDGKQFYDAFKEFSGKRMSFEDFENLTQRMVDLVEEVKEQGVVSNGIYSVMQNKWIKEPVQQNIPDIDRDKFDEIFNEWEDKYFDLIDKIDYVDEKEITEGILVEGTKYDKLASKIISDSGLFDEETSDKIIQALFKEDIHAFTHAPSWLEKYLKGIARMIVQESNGDRQRAQSFLSECPSIFDEYLTWIKENRTEENKSKLDSEFIDRMSYQDVKDFLDKIQSQRDEKSKDELSKMEFGNSNFSLVPIDSYEEMHRLYGGRATGDSSSDQYAGNGGTAWCHTNSKDVYDSWVKNGGKFFVLQNNDWKNISFNKESNKNNPKDDYGNSLIALLASRTGKLKNATLRCNHVGVPSSADNQYHTYAELSRVAGFNVEEEVGKYIEPSEVTPQDILNISFDGEVCFGIINEFQDEIEEVIIPDGVKAIGSYAFASCEVLTKVKIPNSVEKIGYRAFAKSGIESIEIPDSVKLMGTAVFDGCSRLKNVKLSNNLDNIGEVAFRGCKVLEHIEIPTSVKVIGDYAFSECNSLRSVIIPNEVKLIGDYAFNSCSNLQKVSILSDYVNFGEGVFDGCVGLSQINLPNLDNIPPYFLYNTRIQSINIPNGVLEIGGGAFGECDKLVNVNIPSSVKSIYNPAFEGCTALRKISIPNSVQEMGTRVFEDCDQALVVYTDSGAVRGALINSIWFPGQVKPMSEYNESLDTVSNGQLNESKQDIQGFVDKFGQKTYDLFIKSKDRLKNNNISTDIVWHTKNTTQDEMNNILHTLSMKMGNKDMSKVDFSQKQIPGKYNYLGRIDGYDVYQPLDYLSSMALGVNTGWCTTGRYGHYGDPNFKPSEEDAKEHFNNYVNAGVDFYYLLDPNTHYGKIAIAKTGQTIGAPQSLQKPIQKDDGYYVLKRINFDIYNDKDEQEFTLVFDLSDGLLNKLGVECEWEKVSDKKMPTISGNDIIDLRLLSSVEARDISKETLMFPTWWWLMDVDVIANTYFFNQYVSGYGAINETYSPQQGGGGVRPLMVVNNDVDWLKSIKVGNLCWAFGYFWKYIGNSSVGANFLLMYNPLAHMYYSKYPEVMSYEESDIYKYLQDTLKSWKGTSQKQESLNEVYPNKGENKKDFISRFMSVTKDEYPDQKQRYAVALSYWDRRNKNKNESMATDDDIENVKKFLLNIDEEDMFQDEFEKDTIIGPYDVQVWSHLSHFGSAWIPKPVVAIQIDREDKPNGFISYGDIESIDEYRYAVDTLVEKMYEKI